MPHSFSVLILDGGDYGTLKVLRCLGQAPQIRTHLLSRERRPMARHSRHCTKCHYHTSQNDSEWIDVIKRIVEQYKVDVLLPTTTASIEFVARQYAALKKIAAVPPSPTFEQLNTARDKWSFHCFASEHDLPVAPTVLFAEGTRIVAEPGDLEAIEFPALLKPTTEMGGRGIVKIDRRSDVFRTVEQNKLLNAGQRYIMQSFIPGVDLCLGVFCRQGKIASYTLQKDLLAPNNSFGHQKVMEFVQDDRLVEIGRNLVSAIDWNGMAFIDFRIDQRDQTAKLIEVNPRLGRAFLGALAAGINFPLHVCLSAMGIGFSNRQREAVRYAHPSAYFSLLRSRVTGKQTPIKVRWRESGLRYCVSDPLPELYEILQRAGKMKFLRSLCHRKHDNGHTQTARTEF